VRDISIFLAFGLAITFLVVLFLSSSPQQKVQRRRPRPPIPRTPDPDSTAEIPISTPEFRTLVEEAIVPPRDHPKAAPRFMGAGSVVDVAGVQLRDPLIYVVDCDQLWGADASLLCLRRAIGKPQSEPERSLGYWPRLCDLQPYQVGNYVAWLAGGRQDLNIDLGYVFLYFYGLERRALVDGEDILPIAQEVVRLMGVYGYSRSFRGYATALISHMIMLGRLRPTLKLLTRLVGLQGDYVEPPLYTVVLGHLSKERTPLPVEWAIKFASQNVRAHRSSVLSRAPEELSKLFTKRYQERFESGLVPVHGGHEVPLSYRAASPSLLMGTDAAAEIKIARWPALPNWERQFAPVVDLWNECVEELRAFARKVGREGKDSAAAFHALPEELREESKHPLQSAWDKLLAEFSPQSGVILLPVSKLAELRGIERRPRLTVSQSRDTAELAEMLGTPLEPDARYTSKAYAWDEHLAALRLPETPVLPQNPSYLLAAMLLRLSVEVGRADGELDLDERRAIAEFLGERFMLTWNERLRINGLMEVILRDAPSLSGLKKVLATQFTKEQREAMGKYLVQIASATKGVSADEVAALERSFKALGIESDLVSRFLNQQTGAPPRRPVPVAGEVTEGVEIIPPPGGLDLDRIRKLRAESDEVARMLLAAMSEAKFDEEESPQDVEAPSPTPASAVVAGPVGTPTASSVVPGKLDGLRASLHALLEEVARRAEWEVKDFDVLARKHGTTRAAAIEEINAWADEVLGDFLIHEGTVIQVSMELMEQARKA
jgi:uncharacterized tellurite resistance protein B-like protein